MNPEGGSSPLYEHIYRVAAAIPRGRVATYGQIAALAGRCTPRVVGYAMAAVRPETGVPWHRVINSRGEISRRGSGEGHAVQRRLLELEGIVFDERGRIDLERFGWSVPRPKRGTSRGATGRDERSRGGSSSDTRD